MCLRVETLMKRFHYFEALKGDWSAYSALLTILELTSLLERGDLKQELMKELERQHGALKALAKHQEIDRSKLDLVLSEYEIAVSDVFTGEEFRVQDPRIVRGYGRIGEVFAGRLITVGDFTLCLSAGPYIGAFGVYECLQDLEDFGRGVVGRIVRSVPGGGLVV